MRYEIAGARGAVNDPRGVVAKAQAWAAERGGSVLLADASVVFGHDHAESAARHAVRAQVSGAGVVRDLGLEALRYLCARRQVADAIKVGGLRPTTERTAVIAFDVPAADVVSLLGWLRDDAVLAPGRKSLRVLGIGEAEEQTVPSGRSADLALERTALVDLEK